MWMVQILSLIHIYCKYRNFDGVVIVCARFQDNEVQELMSSDIPVVTIDYVH